MLYRMDPKLTHFELALRWIFHAEGGYVNDPKDPGGATRYGISLRYLKGKGKIGDIDGDGDIDADDIKDLTKSHAAELYRTDFWDKCRCDELPLPLAIVLFDQAVNTGVTTAIRSLQRHSGSKVDGVIGPKTIKAANNKFRRNPTWFIASYMGRRAKYYHKITIRNAALNKFLRGWFIRLFDLQQFIMEHS